MAASTDTEVCWQFIRRHQQVSMQSQSSGSLCQLPCTACKCSSHLLPNTSVSAQAQKTSEVISFYMSICLWKCFLFFVDYFPNVPHTLCSVASVPICCGGSVKLNHSTHLSVKHISTQTCLFLGRCSVKMKVQFRWRRIEIWIQKRIFPSHD